jgi:hypothetical protein
MASGQKYEKAGAQFAGRDYFKVFSYRLLQGDKEELSST